MIVSFSFSNFRSFVGEAMLSLEAHGAHKGKQDALVSPGAPLPQDGHLLACAAIYGANAAGKSNVIHALEYMRQAVVNSHANWAPDGPTFSQPHMAHRADPARFEIDLIAGGTRYRYGFDVTRERFTSEWLYAYSKGRQRKLFERSTGQDNLVEVQRGRKIHATERDVISYERRTRPNSLFLSAAAQEDRGEIFDVWSWFKRNLNTRDTSHDSDDHGFTNRMCDEDRDMRQQILHLMQGADSSLRGISVEKDDHVPTIDDPWAEGLSDEVKTYVAENRSYKVKFEYGKDDSRYYIPLALQSEGSRRLHALSATIACVLQYGEVLVIDEIEASFHSHISNQLVALFQNKSTNPKGAQLIFTTHDVNLLANDLLRRDQIWFVEKVDGDSSLYSLLEFKPRKDESLFHGYLRGRYGAVPERPLSLGFIGLASDD